MTSFVLLVLVLGLAAAEEKPCADTGQIARVLETSNIAMDESRPGPDKMATDRRGSKQVLFVKEKKSILDFRKLTNLFLRYFQEKESTAIIKQAVIQALKGGVKHTNRNRGVQTTSSNILGARKLPNNSLRYFREKESAAIIKLAVIQALRGGVTHSNKNIEVKTTSRNTVDSKIRML